MKDASFVVRNHELLLCFRDLQICDDVVFHRKELFDVMLFWSLFDFNIFYYSHN